MRLRALSFILVCLLALAALAASNRAMPLVVEAHASGPWDFNQADYPTCVTVRPAPLQPHPRSTILYPRMSDTV